MNHIGHKYTLSHRQIYTGLLLKQSTAGSPPLQLGLVSIPAAGGEL